MNNREFIELEAKAKIVEQEIQSLTKVIENRSRTIYRGKDKATIEKIAEVNKKAIDTAQKLLDKAKIDLILINEKIDRFKAHEEILAARNAAKQAERIKKEEEKKIAIEKAAGEEAKIKEEIAKAEAAKRNESEQREERARTQRENKKLSKQEVTPERIQSILDREKRRLDRYTDQANIRIKNLEELLKVKQN